MAEMSAREFVNWYIYDEMAGILIETKRLDPSGKMPNEVAIEMTIEHQEKHGWVGRVDPTKLPPKKKT